MRRALIIGIDDYRHAPLHGCVNDANTFAQVLSRNYDGSANFQCKKICAPSEYVTKVLLREKIEELLSHTAHIALLYFSGHGVVNNLGGYLVTPDVHKFDAGVSMQDILTLANNSNVYDIIIILDCGDSGAFGSCPLSMMQSDVIY